jgi:myo-inositol 2-dehydrogenase/D-chiro-inositol 1-dehydrogenase
VSPVGVRIGVVGAGVMGSTHARVLAGQVQGAELTAVADADHDRAAAAAEAAGAGVRAVAEPADVVGDPEVDAVIVASSDDTHEAFVSACLEAGKPVLCEKPLAVTAAAALRLAEAEAAAGRRLIHVGFMRRYDPGFVDLKHAVDAGAVGAPLLVHCVHRNAAVPPQYTSDMLITSSAIHEIDVVRWLLGEEIATATVHAPRSTRRAARRLRDPQFLVLETESGVVVDVEVFANAGYGYDIRCELVGEAGTAALAPPRTVELRRDGREGAAVPDGFATRFLDAYRRELQAWVDGVVTGASDGPTAWDGYAANAVAEACLEALASGSTRQVRLAPRPAFYDDADGQRPPASSLSASG